MDINDAAIKKNIRKLRRVVKLAGQVRDFTLLLLLNNTEINLLGQLCKSSDSSSEESLEQFLNYYCSRVIYYYFV